MPPRSSRPRVLRLSWLLPLFLLLTVVLPTPLLAAGAQAAATATTSVATRMATTLTTTSSHSAAAQTASAPSKTTSMASRGHTVAKAGPAVVNSSASVSGLGELPFYPLLSYQLADRMDLHVNLANGNLLLHELDLAVPGTGLGLTVDRFYNNLNTGLGSVGLRWTTNVGPDVQLQIAGTTVTFTGPSGYQFAFTQNPDHSFTSPAGADATLVQNGDGSYTLTFHATGSHDTFTSTGMLSAETDQNGNTIGFAYNGNGTLNTITDTQGRVTNFQYGTPYGANLITEMVDSSGRPYNYVYNTTQNPYQYTPPSGPPVSYTYDANNQLVQLVDENGDVITLTYDGSGRITKLSLGSGTATYTFTYNAGSTVVTDPNGHQTTYDYDTQGRLTQVVDALGNTHGLAWTADNHVQSSTDAYGKATSYSYDGNNNLTQVQIPTGATTKWAYGDSAHPYYPTSVTDAQGNTTSYRYDAKGNLSTITDALPSQNQASMAYNANGTMASSTDFNGNTTTYSYDAQGNLIKVTPPAFTPGPGSQALGPTTIVPDALSRPSSVTDGNGNTTAYTYDAVDRVTNVRYADGTSISYQYDWDGNLTMTQDSITPVYYNYNALNEVTQKSPSNGMGGNASYGYDPAGNLTSYADAGGTVGYAYNALNELTTLTEPGGAQTSFGYDANGQRTSMAFPDSVAISYGYDASQRLANITAKNSSTTLVGLSYSYASGGTDTGLLQTVQENDAPGVGSYPTRNFTTTYTYDPRNLQQSWVLHNNADGSTIHSYHYQYDANGNRSQIVADPYNSQGQIVPSPSQGIAHSNEIDLAYTPVNELLTTTAYSKLGALVGTANWYYDQAGNQTGNSGYAGVSGPLTITYNRRNQTTGISDVYGTLVPMTYAGAGQGERLSAGWSNQPSPTDPTKPPEYGNTTYTYSALGLMSKTDTTGTTSYTRAPSGQPISERTPNGTFYYILDGLGNAVMLVDPPNGAPAWISAICPTGNDAGGSWQSPTIGGGNVGNQNILTYAAYVPSGSFDAGTHNFHSLWGYQSTDNGNNNQFNTCANLNPFAKLFCGVIHAMPGPGGSIMMNPGLYGGQGEFGGGGGSGAGNEVTVLYRAVEPQELADIQASGAFTNIGGIESKYFATSAEGAASFAQQASEAFGTGPYTIVRTTIPSDLIAPIMKITVDRGGIQTVVIPSDLLPALSAPQIVGQAPGG